MLSDITLNFQKSEKGIMSYLHFVLLNLTKIVVAGLCAVMLGLPRSRAYKPASISSLVLIGIGACLFMIVTLALTPIIIVEPYQIAVNVMLGITVLGIVIIVKNRAALIMITTVASIWIIGAVGLAIGSGLFLEGILITLLVYFLLSYWVDEPDENKSVP
jgi:putative Mg2+ transporter-C (MgtC) family protein